MLIEQGELTPEEAWDRLTARTEELGWDRPTDLQGGPVSGGASGSEEPAPVDADGRESLDEIADLLRTPVAVTSRFQVHDTHA